MKIHLREDWNKRKALYVDGKRVIVWDEDEGNVQLEDVLEALCNYLGKDYSFNFIFREDIDFPAEIKHQTLEIQNGVISGNSG